MRARSSYSVSTPKAIVSRSHSGKVKSFVQDAFGNSTTIIEAGGAGEFVQDYFTFTGASQTIRILHKTNTKTDFYYRNVGLLQKVFSLVLCYSKFDRY